MLFKRTLEKAVLDVNATFPILLLTGARQVGKSTLLEKLVDSQRKIVTLDNPMDRHLAKNDPELFLQRYNPPVMIDEIQYAPELLPFIKIYVDTHKNNGDFWLTGSQSFVMMKNISESLAGRVGILRLNGLSNSEILQTDEPIFTTDPAPLIKKYDERKAMDLKEIFARIHRGSMPALYQNMSLDQNTYFESYIQTYLTRDIRDLTQVADEMTFLNFVQIVAARTAINVNYNAIATEVGISAPTAKQWLSILVSSGLVLLVQPFSNNLSKRIIKSPRLYFLDTGLCSYLTGWSSPEVLEKGAMSGQIFETWVVSEIYKTYCNNGKRPPLYFYKDSNKKEIDLLIFRNGTLSPIEIKKSSAPKDAIKNFSVIFNMGVTIGTGNVICTTSNILPIDKNNWYVPAWLI